MRASIMICLRDKKSLTGIDLQLHILAHPFLMFGHTGTPSTYTGVSGVAGGQCCNWYKEEEKKMLKVLDCDCIAVWWCSSTEVRCRLRPQNGRVQCRHHLKESICGEIGMEGGTQGGGENANGGGEVGQVSGSQGEEREEEGKDVWGSSPSHWWVRGHVRSRKWGKV